MRRNAEPIDHLYRQLRDDVLAFFLRRTSSNDVAEDLVQETFTKVFRRLKTTEGAVPNPAAYLYRTARNVLIDFYRTRRTWEELPELADASQLLEEADGTRSEIAGWMSRFVGYLPEPYRSTLRMSEIDGLPYREIAEKTGVTVGAVKTRVHRGRKLLKRELTDCCRFFFDARGRVVDYTPAEVCSCGCG
jgi:RNA polymerase sigma-70 factor, ECF subfamily